jgi:hypothetical protein
MKKLQSSYQTLTFTEKSAPLAFLVACILGFGLLLPTLGFYMDDWPYVFYAFNKGIPSLREMLLYDSRPNAAWLYMLGFHLLGFKPIGWHITALLMRWVTVVLMWMVIRSIWPNRKNETIQIALLFAVYPFFMLQPFAVGSLHHWFGFMTFNLSILLMIWAVQSKKYRVILILLSMGLETAHLFTSEYFSGLELIRPVILWILIARVEPTFSKRVGRVILNWLPYLAILGVYAFWRVAIFQNPPEVARNTPVLLYQLASEPVQAIGKLLGMSIKDAYSVLTIGWQKATDVDLLNFSSVFPQFRLAISGLTFLLAYTYLSKLMPNPVNNKDDWYTGSKVLALAGIMISGLPVWLIGRSITESKNLISASRFGIPTMFGAALLIFILVDSILSENRKKIIAMSLLLALAVNFHLANTKEFQYSWEKQHRLAQQLIWRAPQITPGTAIFTDEEILGMMGDYAVSFSINTTYQPDKIEHTPPYWYFPFYYTYPNIGDLLQGEPLEYDKLTMSFKGNSKQMLLLSFNPEMNRCLWILQPQDTNLRLVSDDMRQLSAGSNINLIKPGSATLPEIIYGKQKEKGWCYFFEKADLARQYQQWDEIGQLWKEAQSAGEQADNGFEYIPFIEGYGHLEDWGQVKLLTHTANKITAGLEPSLCTALDRIMAGTPASQERDNTIRELKNDIKCENYQ